MDDRSKTLAAGIAIFVATTLGLLVFWNRRPDIEKDYHPEVVRHMEVLGNGDPLPSVIRPTDCFGLRIRFEVLDEPKTEPYSAYIMVVGSDGYETDSVDILETHRQKSDDKIIQRLLVHMGGPKPANLTPKPPGPGDTSIQYCALFDLRSLRNTKKFFGEDMELHLWLYPTPPPPGSNKAVGGPGSWVYRHKFRVEG